MSVPLPFSLGSQEEQDFGDEFDFQEDSGALKSILNNQGISYSQVAAPVTASTFTFTPAKANHQYTQYEDKVEFFESMGGNIFFRKKVVPGSTSKILGSSKKTGFGRSLGNTTTNMKPQRIATVKKNIPFSSKSPKPALNLQPRRTPLASKSTNKLNSKEVNAKRFTETEKKMLPPKPTILVNGFSEMKIKSGIPKPSSLTTSEHHARQSLYKKFDNDSHGSHVPTVPRFQPSLTKLTRESLRMLPRESMAWLTQLPRESATFAELERMMNEDDKKCANDDDTMSFEALENRLRTPYKKQGQSKLAECNKENEAETENDSINLSGVEPIGTPVTTNQNVCSVSEDIAPSDANQDREDVDTIEQDNNEEILTTPARLQRSVSNIDMSRDPDTNDDQVPVSLARCASVDNVASVCHMSPLVSGDQVSDILNTLDMYQDQLDRFREEQDNLARQEQELLIRIRERKSQFKQLFGVSPLSIKTKKTVLEPRPEFKLSSFSELTNEKADKEIIVTPVKDDCINAAREIVPETEKKVRFNTEENQTIAMTPQDTDNVTDAYEDIDVTPVTSHDKTRNRNKSRKSFDSLKCSLSFLKTPQTAARNVGSRATPATAAPTPMALR